MKPADRAARVMHFRRMMRSAWVVIALQLATVSASAQVSPPSGSSLAATSEASATNETGAAAGASAPGGSVHPPERASSDLFAPLVEKGWWRAGDRLFLQFAPYTLHFHQDPEHEVHNRLINLEYQRDGEPWLRDSGYGLFGYANFLNSFGQPSWYLYYGRQWETDQWIPHSYVKVSAGVVYGYKDQYEDKVPFNHNGYAPAIIPSFGVRWHDVSVEAILLGWNAMMFGIGYRF